MSNHYHQLVRVPGVVKLSDDQLLKRLKAYYGEESLEAMLFADARERGEKAVLPLRRRHLKRMGNISEFEKVLKQGFSSWYNRRHNRRGTLWMERFKSVMVEDSLEARGIMATYIDLNPVRAEMVEDPKNYRHCGYGAAMGGDERCRRGIMKVTGIDDWQKTSVTYRLYLMERGQAKVRGKTGSLTRELRLETLEREGHLPLSELLRLRVRYFTDGMVLGSELFVEEVFERNRSVWRKAKIRGPPHPRNAETVPKSDPRSAIESGLLKDRFLAAKIPLEFVHHLNAGTTAYSMERAKRFELSTSTLARWCSTN